MYSRCIDTEVYIKAKWEQDKDMIIKKKLIGTTFHTVCLEQGSRCHNLEAGVSQQQTQPL